MQRLIAANVDVNSWSMVCAFTFDEFKCHCIFAAQNGETALHFAAENGHVTVVQALIGAYADLNLLDKVL